MTTLHKLNETTLVLTVSEGKQYLITEDKVTTTTGIITADMEVAYFDAELYLKLDSALRVAANTVGFAELAVMIDFVKDKIEQGA